MKELGITKGEWEAVLTEKVESHLDIAINSDDDCIAWVYSDSLITSKEDECLANAKLIADAGTTANKCNMLPSELLERYNEAIEVLEKVNKENRTLKSLIKSLHLYEHATTYNFELEYKDHHYDADTSFLEAQKGLIESEQTISKAKP